MSRVTPRVLFIDSDPSTISKLRLNDTANLFDPEFLVSGSEDMSNIYTRGAYTLGR
jgi:hypothetical protein